jgi:hypothetical protein
MHGSDSGEIECGGFIPMHRQFVTLFVSREGAKTRTVRKEPSNVVPDRGRSFFSSRTSRLRVKMLQTEQPRTLD